MTFRLRLILYYSSLLIGILLLFGGAVFATLRWAMLNQVDATLNRVTDDVRHETRSAIVLGPNGQPQLTAYVPLLDTFRAPGVFVQIWKVGGEVGLVSSSQNLGGYDRALDPKVLPCSSDVQSTVTINGVNLRVITKPIIVQGQVVANVQAATSLSTIEAASDRLAKIMLGCGLIALLISLLLGDLLARHVLRPVSSIVTTARRIAKTDDLSRRIPYHGPHDELGSMVMTFNETLERLQKLFESQRRFISDVSHELRTPLTTIQGNLDLLRRYGNDPKSLEAMQEEVRRMTVLVGDLLMLAKADAGQIPFAFRRLDLTRFIREIYDHALELAGEARTIRLGNVDEEVVIWGDADQLHHLFGRILHNAVKYTPQGGTIEISLTNNSHEVYIKVKDTGIGIPAEDLPHVFDRFYRVDKARSRAAGGTGLGLSIAQWIAEAHSGKITVDSKVGEGTTFTVCLPISEDLARTLVSEKAEQRLAG